MAMIEEKVKHPEIKHAQPRAKKQPSNVIDLMSVLEESLSHTKTAKTTASKAKAKPAATKVRHRKAA